MGIQYKIVMAGRGALLLRCAEECLLRGHDVVGLISNDASARAWAQSRSIAVYSAEQCPESDYHILVGYPEELHRRWPLQPHKRVIAFQDSLLPAYAGWHATTWSLLNRESTHGITWYSPDSAGPLALHRSAFPVGMDETAFSLDAKCFDAGLAGFVQLLGDLENQREQVLPALSGSASFYPENQRPRAACLLDFSRPADALTAFVRALDFAGHTNPLGLPKLWLGDEILVVREVDAVVSPSDAAPGTLLALDEQSLTVATGEGGVILRKLTDGMGRSISPIAVLQRHALTRGSLLPSLPPDQAALWTETHERLAPLESFWVRRLAVLEPLVLPFAQPTTGEDPNWDTIDFPPAPGIDALAAHAAFFIRVADVEQGDVELQVDAEFLAPPAAAGVPLHIAVGYGDSFADFCTGLAAEVLLLRGHKTHLGDLALRYPELSAASTTPLPIRISVGLNTWRPGLDTVLHVEIDPAGGKTIWHFNVKALPPARAHQLAMLFSSFLQNLNAHPERSWRKLSLCPSEDRAPMLDRLANKPSVYPVDRDLGEWMEAVAAAQPESLALVFNARTFSYRELNARANQMASLLKTRGVGPDTRMGLFMDRSAETLVALLGILKAGGCYVPLDPAYPRERLAYMMEHANLVLLLTQTHLHDALPPVACETLVVDAGFELLRGQSEAPVSSGAKPEHLCYVIYTSGSTGNPKGVAMTRRAMLNLVHWQNSRSTPNPVGRTFQYASLSFDVSVQEMFSTWLAGGTLVLVPDEVRRDPIRLLHLADETGVQRWFMPYAALQQVAVAAEATGTYPAALRDVITAGEALRITPEIRRFFQHLVSCRLHNQYGPSETHVATAYVLPGDSSTWPELPSIGGPIANTRLALLDANGDPVPEGFAGELFIGGDCLARGYLDQPALTRERFVELAWPGRETRRFYRTGDLARLMPDGLLEFLGRRDDQVKIRGYRVELGEVEAALSRHPQVRECVVMALERGGARQLVAYVSVHTPPCDTRELRTFLQGVLPDYMLPSTFVFIDEFPLTPSGKIHRRGLPEPKAARSASVAEYRPPQSDVERMLGHLWQQVLGLEQVGITDNFFELGGDSLKLASVQAALRTNLGRDVPMLDLFRFPTIAALADHLSRSESAAAAAPRRRPVRPLGGDESIAVVGLAGRFPGAENIEQLWANICAGKETISSFAEDELEGVVPKLEPGSGLKFIKARGVLDRCEWFDAGLFGYGPRDAELMDPQHRVFLECAWEALEHAGCDPARYPGAIGVFAAVSLNTYLMNNVLATRSAVNEMTSAFQVGGYSTLIGNDKDYVATRVAYKLNLRGPSMSIQAGCSSSLVAICQACQSLAAGACDAALAGGVSISFPQKRGYLYVEGSIASADGHCRPFDASAAGTVFGAGAGIVVLKRLADAEADGDTVYAVLKGWALNNDGAMKAGFMAPSADGQAEVIRMAQERAAVDPRTIGLVETHGTGTPLGDPIEVAGLTRAFRVSTAETGFCALGSVKANIGHLESAAGVTGLIKTVLSLHRAQIPPLLHFERPNPLIDLLNSPFYITRQLTAWPSAQIPRRAAVSSFGVGGTNAHVVLEEAPLLPRAQSVVKPAQLLLLSARTESALTTATSRLADFLEQRGESSLNEVAYTLQTGRQALERRGFIVASEPAEAISGLRAPGVVRSVKSPGRAPSVVFLFPGQGSQHVDMGRGIYENEPLFRQHVDACSTILRPLLGLELTGLLYPDPDKRDVCQEQLTQTRFAQPALFTISYALARWWMSMGVQPAAMIGHSVGEYVGAVLAGLFSIEDALAILIQRAELMQALPSGRMLAVRLSEEELQPYLSGDISLAAANAPSMSVVSGPSSAIESLSRQLESKGIGGRLLQTSHAFHSDMMTPALEPFRRAVERVKRRAGTAPFLSSMTGSWLTSDQVADPLYWARQIREPVRFSRAVREAQKQAGAVFLEVGSGQALTTLALQHDTPEVPVTAIPSLRHAREGLSDYASLLRAVGRLWQAGQEVDWKALQGGLPPRRIALPSYPFERKRYWIEPPKFETGATALQPAIEVDETVCSDAPVVTDAAVPQDTVLNEVLDILQDLSGIERAAIVPQRPFLEMGFDSLFLTQVSLAFQRKFLVKLTLRQMLDDLSSPAAIAAYIAAQKPAPVAPVLEAATPAREEPALTPAGPFGPEEQGGATPPPAPVTRHGPYAPINKSAGDALTPRQQQHLDALIARYTKKTARSKEYTQRNRAHFADPRTVAGFRLTWKEMTYPVVSTRSAGSKIWDLDDNEYLDVTMGFGTNLFGHNPAFVRTALERQLVKGIEIGPQSALAGEVARMFCEMTGQERATFCNTGSEAVMGAVRAARTVTGRQRIVYFAGDYHGVNDEVLAKGQTAQGKLRTLPIAPGIPRDLVSQVTVLPYGDPASLDILRGLAPSLAAVLVEPVQSRKPELQPREFLHAVRDITRQAGTVLIFDEVITGFRVHPGGAQAWFGVKADIATYGKIIGGGLPIGVIAGAHTFMDAFDGGSWQYGDASVPEAGVTFFAGTFVRHPLAMAAAQAVLHHLRTEGPELQRALNERTARFTGEVNTFLEAEGIDLKINHFGSLWYFSHGEGFKYFSLMFHFLRDLGIHIWEGRPCFLSTAHSEADVARLVDGFKRAIAAMREGGFLTERVAPVSADGPFPLTEAQQEIWLAERLDATAAPAFNESCSLTFRGALNRVALETALRQVVERHEALRTTVDASGEQQRVQLPTAPDLLFADLTGVNEREREQRLSELVRDEVRRPFDLARAPLLRGRLIQLEPSLHVLVLTAHHIVCDGWSYDVMSRDVGELYSLVCKGQRDQRPAPMQFRDYARWMAAYRREARYDTDLTYWTRLLASPPQAVQLPTDQARSPVRTFQGAMEVAMVEGPLCSALKELGMRKRCTQFSTLLAVYAVLLHRLTGQSDLIIGIPAAGQQLVEGQDLVGHCANLLPLRLSLTSDQTFADVMAQAQQALLDAYEHQGLTFGALLKSLQLPRDPSRAPLIQVTFNVDPAIHGLDFEGLETSIVINPRTAYQFEHSLNIVVQPDGLRLECNYNTGLFGATTAARWLGHFREIARAVAETSELTVAEIPLLSADEQKVQLLDWNQTTTPYPSSACIHELFEQEVRVHPDRIALSLSGKTITYRDLNRLANQLARKLIALGIVTDQPVGICTERSLDMVIGLLGILKAGGAYLPLDPTHPPERLRLQLTDADVKVSVVQGKFAPLLADQDVQRVVLDDESADWRTLADDDVALSVQSSQLAYVLFTSGSTGQPKGVLIEHRSVVRLVKGSNFMTWNPDDRMLQHSPLAFDASTLELWGPLLNGCCMALLPPGPFTYQALAKAIREERVTKLWLTGSVFHQVADDYPDSLAPVKHLLAGGEVLSGVRIERLLRQRPDLLITNGYGPTESTTFATTETFTGSDRVDDPPPLGRPISNTQVYVLDERLQPVPVGVTGELCIGGDGLARGYLKRPELTRQVFVPNPFPGTPGDRLYRTGDLARYRANGKLEFLGRRDNQVKIRGFRIEPGEVESVLSTYPGLRNCAVIVRVAANGEKQLAAYLAMKDGEPSPEVAALRTHLLRALPDYMMPTVISVLPSLPLTSSGKVDRNHLSDPVASSRSTADVQTEPTSAPADMVAAIWADVLNLPHVNQRDDFFALGGHSLAALKMIDRLREAGYELEVADLFRHSTVEAVVKVMKQLRGAPLETTQGDAVVRLKDGRADLAPLCLLPSDFGDLLIYTNLLPLLAPDQPCIGLQSPRIFERDEGIASMTDYAAFFVRQLRSVQPKGPYLLAGYCFGGLVAMEMAKQLMAAGQTIGLLALIDARPFSPLVERSERLLMLLQGALRASVSDWKRHLAAKWSMKREAMLINWMATKNPEKLSRRDYNRWMLETKVLANYRSTEYDGAITYFYPEESQYQLYDDPTCGWLNMAERVSLYKVSGSHLNMMKEPHVRLLAEQLQACIRRANGT